MRCSRGGNYVIFTALRYGSKYVNAIPISCSLRDTTPAAYQLLRNAVARVEQIGCLGYRLHLNDRERAANKVIMEVKNAEIQRGLLDPTKYSPGHHIFSGVLHAHDMALCSTEFLIQLTYRENLWICTTDEGCKAIEFRFSIDKPTNKTMDECTWEPMEAFRERQGEDNVRKYLLQRFSMYPLVKFDSNNHAWIHFMSIFILLNGLLLYAPIWADYYYNALKEFYADGVQYLELRSLLPELYCINGEKLTIADTVGIYKSEVDRFMANNPDFIGSKLIYAPLRGVEPKVVEDYIKTCVSLNKQFPDFLVGFDLVGQEELGRPLIDFVDQLLTMPEHINFYFHAGETNWFGSSIDENLFDAILMGTKRIGHGYAITKHPVAMKLCKFLDIPIEVCPMSNQVLQLSQDYRSHPAALLIAENVPIVISSDDPSFWRATPLSHDFYFAFLGIAPWSADLRFLKCLAMNSIKYSALEEKEKPEAFKKWQKKWDKWIDDVAKLGEC